MKKILIVDDNQNNRMILHLLLEDYLEENPHEQFEIKEAQNGKEACDMAMAEAYDLILMDIMMPEMDGIEATRLIRDHDKNTMIIAVSAVDDSERKKKILSVGAEDYISKPVNADIFQSRITNYLAIISSRSQRTAEPTFHYNDEAVNLFTREIYSRHTAFFVHSEDSLSEFWEYYLLEETVRYDNLSDVVRTIFALGDLHVKLGNGCHIIVEESEHDIYFTLDNLEKIGTQLIKLTLAKNAVVENYKMDAHRISIALPKISSVEPEPVVPVAVPAAVPPMEPAASAPAADYVKAAEELRVYNYMDIEDLEEMEDFMGNLSSLLLLVGSGDMTEDEVGDIASYIERIAKIMTVYPQTYDMAQAMQDLSGDILAHIDIFQRESGALGPMCGAFNNDLHKWMRMTFHDGSPSLNFMDATIIANAQTISGMLKMDDAPAGDAGLDDIFDF